MLLRSLLIMVNLTTIVAAIVVLHDFPQYAGAAFYVLVGWMVGSLVLLYGPWANRPLNSFRTGAATPGTPATAPLPSAVAPSDIPFCIYCAAPLPLRAPVCPACGHRAPYLL